MAKRVTRWRPDTCDCVLEYEWDDAVALNKRTHVPIQTPDTFVCTVHAALKATANKTVVKVVYDAVSAENAAKNQEVAKLLERMPDIAVESVDESGNTIRDAKPEHAVEFSFDANRHLRLRVAGVADGDVARALAD